MNPRPRSATDGDSSGPAVTATAGERFARALAKDGDALCVLLAGQVDFQALTPGRHWQANPGVTPAADAPDGSGISPWLAANRLASARLVVPVLA